MPSTVDSSSVVSSRASRHESRNSDCIRMFCSKVSKNVRLYSSVYSLHCSPAAVDWLVSDIGGPPGELGRLFVVDVGIHSGRPDVAAVADAFADLRLHVFERFDEGVDRLLGHGGRLVDELGVVVGVLVELPFDRLPGL